MMVYKKNVIEALQNMASKDFQSIAWFENNQNLCSSYNDVVEAIFMDTGLEEALDNGKTVFGKEADAALRDLDRMADSIGYHRDERDLIDAPEMQAIRDKAARCLALIEASDGAESTVEIIE